VQRVEKAPRVGRGHESRGKPLANAASPVAMARHCGIPLIDYVVVLVLGIITPW
jgi:hypothetical protein